MSNKPPDIGDKCYLYETYGKCGFGIACRFAKSHVTDDLQNKISPDISETVSKEKTVSNVLNKDLQVSLWKRRYNFDRADETLKKLGVRNVDQKRRGKIEGKQGPPQASVKETLHETGKEQQATSLESEKGESAVANVVNVDEAKVVENVGALSDASKVQTDNASSNSSSANGTSEYTMADIPDAEKKKVCMTRQDLTFLTFSITFIYNAPFSFYFKSIPNAIF